MEVDLKELHNLTKWVMQEMGEKKAKEILDKICYEEYTGCSYFKVYRIDDIADTVSYEMDSEEVNITIDERNHLLCLAVLAVLVNECDGCEGSSDHNNWVEISSDEFTALQNIAQPYPNLRYGQFILPQDNLN